MNQQVEFVARALYDAEDDAHIWESEPEILKEEFRKYARDAIAILAQHRAQESDSLGTMELSRAA